MRKIVICFIICSLLVCSCGKKADTGEEITLKDNQSMVIGKITELTGNDMTVSLVEEKSMSDFKGNREMSSGGEGGSGMSERGNREIPSEGESGSEMPERGNREMSSEGEGGSEMPERGNREMSSEGESGSEMPERGNREMSSEGERGSEMPQRGSSQTDTKNASSENSNNSSKTDKNGSTDTNERENRIMYVETGETASYRIPVGTTVTTTLGAKTTFSRLAEEDTIKIVLEKDDSGNDVIVGIWIVE